MKSRLVEIKFYFPQKSDNLKSKRDFVRALIEMMRQDGNLRYAGYLKEEDLFRDLWRHLGSIEGLSHYQELSGKKEQNIQKIIRGTVLKCHKALPLPTRNYIFVFPWFPGKEKKVFQGSVGFATYSCVFYIFIDVQNFTQEALANSVAHELNHTIFYYYHYNRFGKYTLLDNIVLEGLAENFREGVMDQKPAPWAIALKEEKAIDVLKSLKPYLSSRDSSLYRKIFFGDAKYKRWTGYSIGYWLVKEFRKKQTKLSWTEIMKIEPQKIFRTIISS